MLWNLRRRLIEWPGVGLVWYFGFLFPAMLAPDLTRGLEHRLYVPMIGLLIVLAELDWPDALRFTVPVRRVAATGVVVVFAAISVARLPIYQDSLSFWQSAVESSPHSARAWKQLALQLFLAGQLPPAAQAAVQFLELEPDDAEIQLLLGSIHFEQGSYGRAETELKAGLEKDPEIEWAWRLLSDAQRKLGRRSQAASSKRRADGLRQGR